MSDKSHHHGVPAPGADMGRAYADLKRRYDDLIGNSLAGVFRTTITGRFLECNMSLVRMLGFSSIEELMQWPVRDLYLDEADRERFLNELSERCQLINYEVVLRHKSGRTIHVLENVHLHEQEGRPAIIEGTVIDITAFRQAELEQRALSENYRQLVERMRDGILIVEKGRITYANPAAHELLGSTHVVGSAFVDHVPSGLDLEALLTDDPEPVLHEIVVRSNAGTQRELELSATRTLHQRRPAIQVTLHDPGPQRALLQERVRVKVAEEVNLALREELQEHQRTQEALGQSRRFARGLIDSSLDMIIAVDQQGNVTEFNPAATIKFGYETDEVMGRNARMFYAEEQGYERVQVELDRHGAFAGEVRNITSAGREFMSFLAASRVYDENGRLLGSMGVSRDITQAKRDQEALRASEARYRDLFENASDLIQSVDGAGRIQYVNRAWRSALGYSEAELKESTIWDLIAPAERGVHPGTVRSRAPRRGRGPVAHGAHRQGRPQGDRTGQQQPAHGGGQGRGRAQHLPRHHFRGAGPRRAAAACGQAEGALREQRAHVLDGGPPHRPHQLQPRVFGHDPAALRHASRAEHRPRPSPPEIRQRGLPRAVGEPLCGSLRRPPLALRDRSAGYERRPGVQ
ncbi:MAG: PAS domain S-box protein [Flavobacteriales bacterium]